MENKISEESERLIRNVIDLSGPDLMAYDRDAGVKLIVHIAKLEYELVTERERHEEIKYEWEMACERYNSEREKNSNPNSPNSARRTCGGR